MAVALRLALWNANCLSSHPLEHQTFSDMHKIDIALISETHFTSRTVFWLPRYIVFHSIHPDDTAHGGAAVLIRSSLRHHEHLRIQTPELQAIAVHLEALPWPLTVSAVYCPSCHAPSSATYSDFLRSLGPRFLAGGDWNARDLSRPKDALSSLKSVDAMVPISAPANRPIGRRTTTGYLTCWISLSPEV